MLEQSGSANSLAVVIPTWLRDKQLVELLNSLSRQVRLPDEIIVVCRHDDQGSIAALAEWAGTSVLSPRHKLVKVDREGHLPPLMAAWECCKSDIFCLIDDDAIPREDWLQQLESDFSDPSVGGIGGTIINHCSAGPEHESGRPALETPGKLSWFGRSGKFGRPDEAGRGLFIADCPVGCNMAFRRIALEGAFDMVLNNGSAISYETDVALNVKNKGFDVFYDPRSVVDHYLNPRKIQSKRGWNPQECYVYAHNLTYICLKHLKWHGKLGFIVYFFIGGSWGCPGLVTFALSFLRGRPASWRQQFIPSMKGRLCGLQSYHRSGKIPERNPGQAVL
jgi:GT2 family glycosyltransferase